MRQHVFYWTVAPCAGAWIETKKIFIGITVGVVFITLFTCCMTWRTNDLSMLAYLIPAVFTEFATATGFYYWKAKNENVIKIGKNCDNEGEI